MTYYIIHKCITVYYEYLNITVSALSKCMKSLKNVYDQYLVLSHTTKTNRLPEMTSPSNHRYITIPL